LSSASSVERNGTTPVQNDKEPDVSILNVDRVWCQGIRRFFASGRKSKSERISARKKSNNSSSNTKIMARKKGGRADKASTPESKKLDAQCKTLRKEIFNELKEQYPELRLVPRLTRETFPGQYGSCEPDGGLWYYHNILILVVEGKKQNTEGNAGERWHKNHAICRHRINKTVTYLTFGSGTGSCLVDTNKDGNTKTDGEPYAKGLLWAIHFEHEGEFGVINDIKPGVNNYHYQVDGWERSKVKAIWIETLLQSIHFVESTLVD